MRIGKMIKYDVVAVWEGDTEEKLTEVISDFEKAKRAAQKYKKLFENCEILPQIIIRRLEVKVVGTLEV